MSQFIYGFLAAIVIPVIVFFSAGYFGLTPQIKPLVVQSGSMEPAIKTGSVVFTQKSPDYKKGDVITFSPDNGKNLITHRISSFDGTYFQTKGDANEEADFWKIKPDRIKGKIVLYIPYLGFGVDFVKHPKGFIFLVIIPATIIIYEELKTIKAELAKLLLRFRPIASAGGAPKMMVIFPLFGLGLLLITFTGSFFLDKEEALNNVFAAAVSFGSPTPTPSPSATPSPSPSPTPSPSPGNLLINEVYYRIAVSHRINNSEAGSEWAELYNQGGSPITIASLAIEDNTSCDTITGPFTIPAGGFAIVTTHTETDFRAVWTTIPVEAIFITSPTAIGNGLANNDELILKTGTCALGTIIDHISWGSNTAGLNPSIPMNSSGVSSERSPDGVDTNTNADFANSSPPTPGT